MNTETEIPGRKARVSLKTLIKVLVSSGLLILAYASLDIGVLLAKLAQFRLTDILVLSTLYLVGQLISARKWQLFLSKYRYAHFLEVSRAYFLGMFLNVVGLGTLGGDIVRSVSLAGDGLNKKKSLLVVVTDRIHGLGVLLLIGAVASLSPLVFSVAPRLFLLSFLPLLALISASVLARRLGAFAKRGPALLAKLQAALEFAMDTLLGDVRLFFKTSLLSLCVHALQIGMYFCILTRLGYQLPLLALIAIIPVVNFASSLPISISGVGIREASLILLLSMFGVAAESAALAAFVWFAAASIASVLPYPLMYPFKRRTSADAQLTHQNEQEPSNDLQGNSSVRSV